MKADISRDDRIVFDRLLTRLATWMDGAVDYWTIVILSHAPPDPRAFVLKQCELMRSLVVVTRSLLAACHRADSEPEWSLLNRMAANCQKLQDAFLILEQFRTLPPDEVRPATVAVAEVYHDLHDAIRQLGQTLGLSITYWQSQRKEFADSYQRILDHLFDQLCHERETGEAAAAVYSVPSRQTK